MRSLHLNVSPLLILGLLAAPLCAQQATNESEQDLDKRARAIHARVLTLDTHKDISPQLAPAEYPEDPVEAARMRQRFDPTERGD